MKKTSRLGALLGIGTSLVAGCSLEKKAFNETQLLYNSQDKSASIWAVDYDGVKEVTLSDSDGSILLRDPLDWTYIRNPHMVSVTIEADRPQKGVYVDDKLKKGLPDGKYTAGVRDIKGNYFEKSFRKEQDKITSP